ncbi:conserved hypothetical protein, partial [Ixodes scapularis]
MFTVVSQSKHAGLTYNQDNCVIGVEDIAFLLHVIAKEGIRLCPSLIICVLELPAPDDKLAVQRMLGGVNYLTKFLPPLAQRTSLRR